MDLEAIDARTLGGRGSRIPVTSGHFGAKSTKVGKKLRPLHVAQAWLEEPAASDSASTSDIIHNLMFCTFGNKPSNGRESKLDLYDMISHDTGQKRSELLSPKKWMFEYPKWERFCGFPTSTCRPGSLLLICQEKQMSEGCAEVCTIKTSGAAKNLPLSWEMKYDKLHCQLIMIVLRYVQICLYLV